MVSDESSEQYNIIDRDKWKGTQHEIINIGDQLLKWIVSEIAWF